MCDHGRDDADSIDVVTTDEGTPVGFDVGNIELARDFRGMFATGAGDRHYPRAFTIFETGNLRRLRKTCSDDANVNSIFHENDCWLTYLALVTTMFTLSLGFARTTRTSSGLSCWDVRGSPEEGCVMTAATITYIWPT